jgi:thioredoxin reductase (NADPH)
MQEKVTANPKIKIMWNTEVGEVVGSGKLEKLILKNNKTGETSDFPVDGLFVAIGHKPASDIFANIIKRDEKGYIEPINWHCGTSVKGVFTAGDVMDKHFKQAIVASGMGCIAGMEALKYLEEE